MKRALDILTSLTHWLEGFLNKEHICGDSLEIGQDEVIAMREKARVAALGEQP